MLSVQHVAKTVPYTKQHVAIFDDHSTTETLDFLKFACNYFTSANLTVELIQLPTRGLFESARACFDWLEKYGVDLVYQVQDDYLYEQNAIFEMIDIFMQVHCETNAHPVISPYNHPYYWIEAYKYQATPRVLVAGSSRYWIQLYEIPCTFMTSKHEFSKHWDLYENFFNGDLHDPQLEVNSFNQIITKREVLGIEPITSIALHMQAEFDKDPYIDWKSRWDSIIEIMPS
ncbi:MAG: hypothetical protein ACOVLB_03575 [Candidatus Nanopelagicus sp.]